ncbi:MAG: YkgJ family cysteine cluster protein [Candidatus Helarchaeota archaeon]
MQQISKLKNFLKINEFIKIFEIFEPILEQLKIPNYEYDLQKKNLIKYNRYSYQEIPLKMIYRFHTLFKKLIVNAFIENSLKVHDLIREAFLNRIANESPDCLFECRDIHGCCHGNYSVDLIDYKRIILEDLLPANNFIYKNCRYRIKLKEVNGENICSAFDMRTKYCLIHKYKPPTCCKYPLISNTFIWNKEKQQWLGNCAHGGIWATFVSPVILQGLNKLWVKSTILWEREQEFISKFTNKMDSEKIYLGKKLLAINMNHIQKQNSILNLLSEEFSKEKILQIMNLMKI